MTETRRPLLRVQRLSKHFPITHGFFNTGEGQMRFLCLVPKKGDAYSEADG